jgi:hypothetical protein
VRIFAYWVIVYFGQYFENYRSSPDLKATFSKAKIIYSFLQKMGWATFWAIFHKLIWSP